MVSNGTEVFYITGNHDEMLRKFSDTSMGNLKIINKLVLNLDGKKAWFYHGDVFDLTDLTEIVDPDHVLVRDLAGK